MLDYIIYGMIFLGAGLMVFNIYGFCSYAYGMRTHNAFRSSSGILYVPVILLVSFLLGYLAVGIFGNPDLIVAAILFGGSVFVFIVYRLISNITRRLVENEQREVQLIASQESSRTKTSFLSSISHEMRTPMNVILGLNDMALRSQNLPPEVRQQLEKVRLSARHLDGLINNILDLNRIETGSLESRDELFSLADAVAQINALTQTVCNEKGLVYQSDVQPGAEGWFRGDEMQLKQALLNILDNAKKYTNAPGTVSFRVETVAETEETRTVRFEISDTGIGMDQTFLSQLFGAFAQEDSGTTNRFGGSGLSLAVTKSIVDLMGGTIEARSKKNEGSTFTVTVPLRRAPAPEVPAEAADISLAGRRILLAEDIPENAEIVMDLLELEDVETEHAENGKLALEMFAASEPGHYDAILMDLRMPVMDGLEATRRIRALERPDAKAIPIIALSANAFETDVQQSLAAGMNYHLAKPADAEMLYQTLREQLGKALRKKENP